MELWDSILKNYGFVAAALAYFIYWDKQREKSLSTRITNLEEEFRKTLIEMTERVTEVVDHNSNVLSRIPCIGGSCASERTKQID